MNSLKTLSKSLFVIIFFFVLDYSYCQSKNGYFISGALLDSLTNQPLEYGTVAAYKTSDSSLITGAITNAEGKFKINGLPSGILFLKISFVGYKTKNITYKIIDAPLILTKPILISGSDVALSAITITGRKDEKQIGIEKTKINVSQNIGSVSGSIIDILKNQSSITVDANEIIYLRGNANVLVLMDGIPTTLSSLNAIPASGIETIEVITNPDVKYDSEGTGGIINIISKKNGGEGLNGGINLNYTLSDRINGGIKLNYGRGLWNFSAGYNGKHEKTEINSSLDRQIIGSIYNINQQINSTQTIQAHSAFFSLSSKPFNKNIFALNLKMALPEILNNQTVFAKQARDTLLHNSVRKNKVTYSRKTYEGNVSYKRIFVKNTNELSFDASYSRTSGSRPAEYLENGFLIEKSNGGGTPSNTSIQVNYIRGISQFGMMETGIKLFSRWNNFNYSFYDLNTTTGNWINNPYYSNDLEHKEYIYSGYFSYSDSLLKKLFCKTGLRAEYSKTSFIQKSINYNSDNNHIDIFPFLLLKYNFGKTMELALNYNKRITRPTYPQLNPFIIVIDQMTLETGNKYLQPEITDKIELGFYLTEDCYQFSGNLYYNSTKQLITQITTIPTPEKLILTYVNCDKQLKTGGDFDINLKFSRVFSINPAFSCFYTKTTGSYNGIDLSTNDLAWSGNIKSVFKPAENTEIQLLISYNSPINLPQFSLDKIYYADLSVKQNFMDNKLGISLTLADIFNTRKWNINSENKIFTLTNNSKYDSRILWAGISYNFSANKSSETQRNDSPENDREIIKLGQE